MFFSAKVTNLVVIENGIIAINTAICVVENIIFQTFGAYWRIFKIWHITTTKYTLYVRWKKCIQDNIFCFCEKI